MKKIIKPKQHEEAIYFSDFTGQPFDHYGAPVVLKLEFNYGSEHDQSELTLHLSDHDVEPILDLIKEKLNPDFKKHLERELDENEEQFHNAIEARDPMECGIRASWNGLIMRLLGRE